MSEGSYFNVQSPCASSASSFWKNILSVSANVLSNLRVLFFSFSLSFGGGAKRVSTPGRVGKKNGAFSGALGGSLGLLRCCQSMHVGLRRVRIIGEKYLYNFYIQERLPARTREQRERDQLSVKLRRSGEHIDRGIFHSQIRESLKSCNTSGKSTNGHQTQGKTPTLLFCCALH